MLVHFIWPDCDYQNGEWGCDPVDAYFVGFTPEEVTKHFPDMKFEDKDLSPGTVEDGIGGRIWFLIGKDNSFCDRHAWYYPISHMWNGYSPFHGLKEPVSIESLDELQNIPEPESVKNERSEKMQSVSGEEED